MRSICIIILLIASTAAAQQTESGRRLPPSLERELRLRKGVAPRVVSFADTIRAKTFLSQSLRDTAGVELDSSMVSDSVVVMYDSAVSLTQKAILDSLLVELPEFERTPNGVRFNYPNSSLIESRANVIPFDSTILAGMDPVIKEPSLYLGALPYQPPLRKPVEQKGHLELAAGSFWLPSGNGSMRIAGSERSSLTADGALAHSLRSSAPIPLVWTAGLRSNTYFLDDSLAFNDRKPHLFVGGSFTERIRSVDTSAKQFNVSQHFASLNASFEAGDESALRLRSSGSLHYYNDAVSSSVEELSALLSFEGAHRFSSDRITAATGLQTAGSNTLGDDAISLVNISSEYFSTLADIFDWSIGLTAAAGSDMSGSKSFILPKVTLRKELSQKLSITASYHPMLSIVSLRDLALMNPFYVRSADDSLAFNARRITAERSRLSITGELLTSVDEFIEAGLSIFSTRDQLYFLHNTDTAARSRWNLRSADTRTTELQIGGAMNVGSFDKLTARLQYSSTVNSADDGVLPFVPLLKADAVYHFGRITDKISSDISLRLLSRKDASFVFFGAQAAYSLGERSSLALRLDNITSSASDFWTGSSEQPFAVSLIYKIIF